MQQVVLITGASSGFGRLSANALARAGHIVYRLLVPSERKGVTAALFPEAARRR